MADLFDELDRLNTWETAQVASLIEQGLTVRQARLLLCLAEDSNSNTPKDFAFLMMTNTRAIVRIMRGLSKRNLAVIDGWESDRQLSLTDVGRQFIKQYTVPMPDKKKIE